jgi:hypothetical protein
LLKDDRDMADSMRHSAELYRLLAGVEEAVATGRALPPVGESAIAVAARPVLERMVVAPVLVDRVVLL